MSGAVEGVHVEDTGDYLLLDLLSNVSERRRSRRRQSRHRHRWVRRPRGRHDVQIDPTPLLCQDDGALDAVLHVVVDEVHERHLDADMSPGVRKA